MLYDVGAEYALKGTSKGEAQEVLTQLSSVLPQRYPRPVKGIKPPCPVITGLFNWRIISPLLTCSLLSHYQPRIWGYIVFTHHAVKKQFHLSEWPKYGEKKKEYSVKLMVESKGVLMEKLGPGIMTQSKKQTW